MGGTDKDCPAGREKLLKWEAELNKPNRLKTAMKRGVGHVGIRKNLLAKAGEVKGGLLRTRGKTLCGRKGEKDWHRGDDVGKTIGGRLICDEVRRSYGWGR